MMRHDLLGPAFSFLRRGKGVNVLIVVVTALCMGCFLVMRSFGAGGMAQYASSLSSGDPGEIIVTPGASGQKLNDAAVQAFRGMAGVEAATGVITLPLQIRIGGFEAQSIEVTAVDADALRGRLKFSSGGMFADGAAPQIVLGYGAQTGFQNGGAPREQSASAGGAQGAAPTPPPVKWFSQRAQISLAGARGEGGDGGKGAEGGGSGADAPGTARLYTGNVAGILKEDNSDRNGQAFMSLAAAKKLLRENYDTAEALGLSANSYTEAYVFVDDIGQVQDTLEALARMGYSAQSAVADLDALQLELSLQQTLLAVIEIFSAVTAFLAALCLLLSRSNGHVEPLAARLIGLAALGFMGGLSAAGLSCFFALITNTSSTETVLFGLRFGQSSNLAIPLSAALETAGISMLAVLSAGWMTRKR